MSGSRRFTVAGLCLATLLAGCGTLEPAYHRPALPTPDAFPQAEAAAVAGPAAASVGWRAFFLDPKLQGVIQLALANNRDLRVSIANIQAARAQYHVQRADLVPHLNANATASYIDEPTAILTGSAPVKGEPATIYENEFSANLGVASYELDLFGHVRSLTKAALEQYLATEEARRAAELTLIAEVAADDLTLASDEAALKISEDTLASSSQSLDVSQARFTHGVASQLDVLQAQTLVQQARADRANQTTLVAQDRNALELVVGAPVPAALLPDPLDDQVRVLQTLPAGLPSQVLLQRPDVLQAERQLKAQNAQIGAARAAFFPSITLTGTDGFSSLNLGKLFSPGSAAWSFSPQITLPIFAGGANLANLDYAKAERKVYLAQYEKAIQTAFSEVANALARRATITEQLAADEAQVQAAAQSVKLSQARYERGADTYLNLLIAQRTLYAAQQTLNSARLLRSTNLVTLYQALGGGAASAAT